MGGRVKILSSCEALPVWSNRHARLCRRINCALSGFPHQCHFKLLALHLRSPQLLNSCTFLQRSLLRCAAKRRLLGRIEEGGKITRKIPWRSENCGNNTFRSSTDIFFSYFAPFPLTCPLFLNAVFI